MSKKDTPAHAKNPRVPTFPEDAQEMAQRLIEIIDAGGEQSTLAYAALSRLSVIWVPNALQSDKMGGGQSSIVIKEFMNMMSALAPNFPQ